jgi:hypothetical protein
VLIAAQGGSVRDLYQKETVGLPSLSHPQHRHHLSHCHHTTSDNYALPMLLPSPRPHPWRWPTRARGSIALYTAPAVPYPAFLILPPLIQLLLSCRPYLPSLILPSLIRPQIRVKA